MTQNQDQEEEKRRDEVLKRMLNSKPQPHKGKLKGDGDKSRKAKDAKGSSS